MAAKAPIILAVDTPDLLVAKAWIEATSEYVSGFKLGLEFFSTFGNDGVKLIKASTDADIFLDLKFHDIPNTVASATRQVALLEPRFLTVHASGGRAMIQAAVDAGPDIEITGVTVLTSLGSEDMREIGFEFGLLDTAVRLARLGKSAGAQAIVCSPLEIASIRQEVGAEFTIITPGIRGTSIEPGDDQARTMDAKSALEAGATYLVIGRPITNVWKDGTGALRDRAAEFAANLIN